MANLFASYTGDNSWAYVYSGTLQGQTVTIPDSYQPTVAYVLVKLVRIGTVSGNVTISLYATSGDLPTGSALSSASMAASSVSTSTSGTWYTFDMSDYTFSPGFTPFKIAIVMSHGGTSSSNTIAWRVNNSNAYSGGRGCYKYSGGSWTAYSSPTVRDFAFYVYGYGAPQTMGSTTPSSVTPTSMYISSSVGSDNGATITSRGFYYSSADTTPDSGDSVVTAGSGTGSFGTTISGLSPSTTYYIRSFATNAAGTSVGAVATQATTSGLPTVTTQAVSNIANTSVTGNGNITATGGVNCTRRGFCYMTGTSGDPTTSNSTAYDDGSFGTGAYSKSITGLSASTAYRIRAYAVNTNGTSYGTTVSVTTYDSPTVTTQGCSSVTHNSATANGNITSIGGTSVTRRGFCYIQASSGDPTVSDSVVYDDGSFTTGTYTEGLSGLSTATDYRVRAYAINAIGTSYGTTVALTTESADTPLVTSNGVKFTSKMTTLLQGEVTDKGDFDVTERGFYWGETAETMTNKITVVLSSGLGTFIYRLTGLTAGTTYYYYAYATSSAGTGHGDTIEFATAGANPAIGGKYPLPPNDVEGI